MSNHAPTTWRNSLFKIKITHHLLAACLHTQHTQPGEDPYHVTVYQGGRQVVPVVVGWVRQERGGMIDMNVSWCKVLVRMNEVDACRGERLELRGKTYLYGKHTNASIVAVQ